MSMTQQIHQSRSQLRDRAALAALIAGASLAALPAVAAAQAAPASPAPASPAPATANGPSEVGEVIVTATRREEALSRVPIAVSAVTGLQARQMHITNFQDIPTLVPGATFISTKGPSTATLEIRGQSTTNDAPALEVPVAIFQDDIYYGTLASFDTDFYDVSQIAVLRGPQGTTFGRNVVGGAIQITSNKPELGVNGGEVDLTAETFAGSGAPTSPGGEAQGYFNAALGQDAAVRLAYSLKDVGGYMHNYLTGHNLSNQQSYAFRPSFLWEPTDHLKISAFASYLNENEYAAGYHAYGQGSVIAGDNAVSASPWSSFENVDGTNKRQSFAAQVRGDLEESFGTLTAITSYRRLFADYVDDGDSGPLPANNDSINASKESEVSEEVRLTSPSGRRFEYIAGFYYSYENIQKGITFGFNGTNPTYFLSELTHDALDDQTALGDVHTYNYAPYAEGKFHITDQLAITAGARYTVEDKSGFTDHIGSSPFYGAAYLADFSHDWNDFTPRGILEYTPTHSLLFYASVSTGFKGGGWSLTSTSPAAAVKPLQPEKSTSYELGAKVHAFDNRLSVNVALYEADTRNVQVRSLVGPVLTDTNAGGIRVRGIEVESLFSPFAGSQFGINYAYTDAIYSSFTGCAAGGVNCTGAEVPYVPRNDLKVFGQYRWSLGGSGSLTAHLDDEWSSTTQVNPVNSAQPLAVPYTAKKGVLNGSLIYAPEGARWTFQVWGKNLTNTWQMAAPSNYYFYFLTRAEYTAGDREVERGVVSPPREIGATFSYKF